jgi:hypothetical protein
VGCESARLRGGLADEAIFTSLAKEETIEKEKVNGYENWNTQGFAV